MKFATFLSLGLIAATGAHAETASSFVAQGDSFLSQGELQKAVNAYDSAVSMDPSNYLYVFKRSAAYLSVGRNKPALADLDKVLELRPGFEGALTQRARLHLKMAQFDLAAKDAKGLGAANEEIATEIKQKIADCKQEWKEAEKSQKQKDWEACIQHSSTVLNSASSSLAMRKIRAHCRLAHGDAREALVDLSNIASLNPSDPDPYVTMAKIYYYSFNEYDKAMQQIQRCLRYDQDCKECKTAHREIRKLRKSVKDYDVENRRKKASGHKIWSEIESKLVSEGGLEQVKKQSSENLVEQIGLPSAAGIIEMGVVNSLVDALCDAHFYLKKYASGEEYCESTLQRDPTYANALLLKAQKLMDEENFESAANLLAEAIQEHQIQDNKLHSKLQEAKTLAKRALTKDYYKILGVSRTANEREIKKAYRARTKEYHPDKYRGELSQEQVERKMSDINEAYEVLTDDEKRQRYDMGEDMNGQGGGGPPPGGFNRQRYNGFPGGGGDQFHFQQQFGGFDFGKFAEGFMRQQQQQQHHHQQRQR